MIGWKIVKMNSPMVDMKSRASFRENYLIPAIDNGFIKMTFSNDPTNKNQTCYRD